MVNLKLLIVPKQNEPQKRVFIFKNNTAPKARFSPPFFKQELWTQRSVKPLRRPDRRRKKLNKSGERPMKPRVRKDKRPIRRKKRSVRRKRRTMPTLRN